MIETIPQLLNAHKIAWIAFGLWSPSHRFRILYYLYAVLLFVIVLLSHLSNWIRLRDARSMLEINDISLPPIILTLINIKAFEFFRNRKQIHRVFQLLDELRQSLQDTDSKPSKNCSRSDQLAVQRCKMLTAIMWISCLVCLTAKFLWVLLLQSERLLLFEAELFFDWKQSSDALYYTIVSVQYSVAVYGSAIITTLDLIAPTMYAMLCAYVELLGARLEELGSDRMLRGGEVRCERELIQCVRVHKLCLSLSSELEQIFTYHYTAQFAFTTFGLCTLSYSLSELNIAKDIARAVHFVFCAIAMTSEVFLPCYFGSVLSERSGHLILQLYSAHWPGRTPRFSSTMRIFVERAREPILLKTYRGLFHINLGTFVAVMRTAYTLLSFCSQLV